MLLDGFIKDLVIQHEAEGPIGTLHLISQRQAEAIFTMDGTQQFVSDENMLATLSHASSQELKHMSRVLQYAGLNPVEDVALPRDPREADYSLALKGYYHGAAYAGHSGETQQMEGWIRMLQLAGSECSVRTPFPPQHLV